MSALKICCVWVEGHVDYPLQYVSRLRSMCLRFAPPHIFYCLTDRPGELPAGIEPIESARRRKNAPFAWWKKLELFPAPELKHGRILYLDLDTLVVAPLAPIIEISQLFALAPHAGNFQPKDGRKVVHRYNSSVMVWHGGTLDQLYNDWDTSHARRLWGDQDWIGERCPEAHAMPVEWFPRLSQLVNPVITPGVKVEKPTIPAVAKVILCKRPKNAVAAREWPWFDQMWC